MAERFEQEHCDIKENNAAVGKLLMLVVAAIGAIFVWQAVFYWNTDPISSDQLPPPAHTRPADSNP
jgi:hypothetical protein